jgi:alpha-1,2-rhamnosyltransferase
VSFRPGDLLFCPDATWVLPPTYVDSLREARDRGARIVPLFYDLIPVSFPEYVSSEHVADFRRWLDGLLVVAEFGLAISDTTGKAIEQHASSLGVEFEVATTYLGADFDAARTDRPPVRADLEQVMAGKPYLVVGALEPRKNQELVYRAFELLWRRGSDARLCFIGAVTPLSVGFVRELKASPNWGSRVFVAQDVEDDGLSFCYRHARALIAPSVAEGFDLPTVEALHYSLPVFASRTPLHEEILGANAAYFDPARPEDLADQLSKAEQEGQRAPDDEFSWLDWQASIRRMIELLLEPRGEVARQFVHDSSK